MEGRESMKKYRLLSVLVILSLALTACGGNPASGGDSSKAQQAQETQSSQAAPGGVTVEIIGTEILADGVINTEGYGSLSQTDETWMTAPQYALIDSSGNVVFDYGSFPCRIALNDGLFVNGIVTEQGEGWSSGVYSLFDLSGEQVIGQTYDYLDFYNGYGVGLTRTQIGEGPLEYLDTRTLIDADGNKVFALPDGFNLYTGIGGGNFEFELHNWTTSYFGSVGGYGEGLLWVFTAAGIQQNVAEAQGLTEQSEVFRENGTQMACYGGPYCGYIDLQGNVVIPIQYYSASAFSEGLAAVQEYVAPDVPVDQLTYGANLGGLWNYIDTTGKTVFGGYTDASSFQNGYAYVANDEGKYGYIDTGGAVVIPLPYAAAFGAGDGLFSVGQYTGDRILYGLVDTENNVVVPLEYEDISSCGDGVAYAVKDGKVVILRVQ